MSTFVTVIHVMVCLFLIFVILLQAGRGAGLGFLSGAGQQVFGGRGAGSFLGKVTSAVAIIFMATSMTLAWFASQQEDVSLKRRAAAEQVRRDEAKKAAQLLTQKAQAPKAAATSQPASQATSQPAPVEVPSK